MATNKKKTFEEPQIISSDELKPKKSVKKASKKSTFVEESEIPAELATVEESSRNFSVEPSPEIATPEKPEKSAPDRGALILGGGLLFLGFLLLLGRLLQIPFGDYLWPFIFIVPGVLVFLTALSTQSSSGEGLSILGGILTMLGLVFFAQTVTGLWATWAYIWALVAPTSIGISQMVYGMAKGREAISQSGRRLAMLGLFMFGIGFVFFELIIGISGFGLANFGLPVFPMLLIFAGLIVLVRSLVRGR